ERRWLEHHGVSGEQRRRKFPGSGDQRIVPGGNGWTHPTRPAAYLNQDLLIVLRDLAGNLQFGRIANPGGRTRYLASCLRQWFALLTCDELGPFLAMCP